MVFSASEGWGQPISDRLSIFVTSFAPPHLMAKKVSSPVSAPLEAAAEQPYYLQRAHIKDFRSIRDVAVEFKPGINIIIGPNGSGKTNFVQVVAISIDTNNKNSFFVGAEALFEIAGRKNLHIEYLHPVSQKTVDNRIKLSDLVRQKVSVQTSDGSIGSGTTLFNALYENKSLRFSFADFVGCETILINHGLPNNYTLINSSLDLKVNAFFQVPPVAENFSKSILATFSFAVTTAQYRSQEVIPAKRVEQIWYDSVKSHLENLRHSLITYTPIQGIRPTRISQFYEHSVRDEVAIKGLTFEFKINNDWLPFNELSSGTQRLFYILSELTVSPQYLSNELNDFIPIESNFDKVILLEEPELGIHPDQLEKLLLFLRDQSKKHQIIITTHSPQVLDMLHDDELDRITICELHKTKGTQFRKLKKTQITTAQRFMREQGLFLSDYWRYGSLEKTT